MIPYKKDFTLHSCWGIGTTAKLFIRPKDSLELKKTLLDLKKKEYPYVVLGNKSNILFREEKYPGCIISLDLLNKISIESQTTDNVGIKVEAGTQIKNLSNFCVSNGFSGLEFLFGIPGTVGGAIAGNAGTKDEMIGTIVSYVELMKNNGSIINEKPIFTYRNATFSGIILSATLSLKKTTRETVLDKIDKYKKNRLHTQPKKVLTAGCVFKNPPGQHAGGLIDSCKLKGKRIGGAFVSKDHANFIVNDGSATSKDILELIKLIKDTVKTQKGINLEKEVIII